MESSSENFSLGQGIAAGSGNVINRPFNLSNNSPGSATVNIQGAFKPVFKQREGYAQRGPQVINWEELGTNNPGT